MKRRVVGHPIRRDRAQLAGRRGQDSRQQHRRLVSRVRQRLAETSGGSPFIATVRGLGFRWENLTD